MKDKLNIFWFRRDLRLEDNAGLYNALKAGLPVMPLFIFDTDILDKLENQADARVEFIFNALIELDSELRQYGSALLTLAGRPAELWKEIIKKYDISEVFTNRDYEPYAINRDIEVESILKESGIKFNTFKDQVIFEMNEVVKPDGKPYSIYTPYSNKWRENLGGSDIPDYKINPGMNFHQFSSKLLSPEETGFKTKGIDYPAKKVREDIIKNYDKTRDIPSIEGTSRLSVHLRFGTVSPRMLVKQAMKLNDVWLKELIWREFFMMILYHYPHSAVSSFKPEYERIEWRNNEEEFEAWCNGSTGYPIVDAGMRELNATGFMHNRVRMITASFLCKDLLIDWRWGERYFAEKLLDYELSSNVGNWQWAAGTGCDAAPYFRIFNPASQQQKFDPELTYINKWVPEYGNFGYANPIVDHKAARERTLKAYKEALKKQA